MSKRTPGVITKLNTSLTMDIELRQRLRDLGGNTHGGISRVAEDYIRAYLPVYEYLHKKRKTKNAEGRGLEARLFGLILEPDYLGKALAVAFRELLKENHSKEGRDDGE